MPQLDISVFPTQLFWLALIFIALYLILWKVALPRVTEVRESRQVRIESDLEKAEALKAEAEAALADYEKTVAEATAKAQDSVREAARKMAEDAESQRNALAARLADQLAEAEKRIAGERARAINEIGEIAGDLTKATTSRLIGSEINQDEANAAVTAVLRESA
jgi:F-type H+-transporting ATPase subunit b